MFTKCVRYVIVDLLVNVCVVFGFEIARGMHSKLTLDIDSRPKLEFYESSTATLIV